MPRGNGTGPAGLGPMTGRGAGYCAGYAAPGYMNPAGGRFFGCGSFGGGRGRRNMFYATGLTGPQRTGIPYGGWAPPAAYPSAEAETEILKARSKELEEEIKAVKERINEIENPRPQAG